MPFLKGSQTEKNATQAFAYETMAARRYTIYANIAFKENLIKPARIFNETADQEREHADRIFEQLNGGVISTGGDKYVSGDVGDTEANLAFSMQQEENDFSEIYPEFVKVALEENFPEIAELFNEIRIAEISHNRRFGYYHRLVRDRELCRRDEPVLWQCQQCGFVHYGKSAPEECPLCGRPQGYYEVQNPQLGPKDDEVEVKINA